MVGHVTAGVHVEPVRSGGQTEYLHHAHAAVDGDGDVDAVDNGDAGDDGDGDANADADEDTDEDDRTKSLVPKSWLSWWSSWFIMIIIMIIIMMTIHLSLHPDLSIVPGHPNLPGDSSTTESDNDFDATLFYLWWQNMLRILMNMMMMLKTWDEKRRHTYKQH